MSSTSDIPNKPRRVTRTQIVALVVIAALSAGLGYLHFNSGTDQVSVPAGAHAGQLTFKSCDYKTEEGSVAADCGTLVVPENRRNPRSRLIALPVTRIPARAAHPGAPIFRLEGGPGLTNIDFPAASRFNENHDVVLVGYRGVDGSSVLDCPEVTSALRRSPDLLGDKSFRDRETAFRGCANRLRGKGVDLAGYTLPARVDDLEAARRAMHYGRVDLLSESAGTRTAMIYSWRYPASVNRSVMVGVNPPGHYLWEPAQSDQQIDRYSALCSRDDDCRSRFGDLTATMRRTNAHLPDHWGFLPIKRGNVRAAAFLGTFEGSSGPLTAPLTFDAYRAADHGDASGVWAMSLMADLLLPRGQVWGDVAAVGRIDIGAAKRHFAVPRGTDAVLGDAGNDLLWAGGRLVDAWPANADDNAYAHVPDSKTPTLLIGGSVDGTTPAQNATRELLPHLSNGHQVVLSEFGHTTDFWNVQKDAGTHLINAYLDSGRVDTSRYTRHGIDFTPSKSYSSIAQGLADAMTGLPVVVLLSLLLMWRRVRNSGHLGRKTRVFVRSVYPIVLGLGGWFAAVLVALTAFRTLPIDAVGLVVASTAVPIALGIYLGWVDGARPAVDRRTGLAAATVGALAGAWLGFHCADSPVAILTAIAGAALGANLALIVGDITSSAAPAAADPKDAEVPAIA